MVAHSAAFRHVLSRKIAAAEHGAFAYSVKRGGAGGKLLIGLGAIVVLIGIIMNGSIPVVIVGVLIAGLGVGVGVGDES